MADIELVIKIPEGLKKDFESEQWTALSCMEMKDALMNGTPLPKGHGRLIDAKAILDSIDELDSAFDDNFELDSGRLYTTDVINMIDNAPTIIEAEG